MDIAFGIAWAMLAAQDGGEPVRALNLSRPTAGYTYFNRPSADPAEHDRDMLGCLDLARPVRSVDSQLGTGSGLGLLGALLGDVIVEAADNGVMAASLENCMVVHGWRVVLLGEAEGAALSRLPSAELRSKLAPWIGAARPHGEVVRVWRNDAANGRVNHFALRPGHTKRGQLSVRAAAASASAAPEQGAGKPVDAGKPQLDPKWKKGSIKPAQFAAAPAGSGIVILAIRGMGMTRGNGFAFRRIGPRPDVRPSFADRAPDKFEIFGSTISGGLKTFAFALPPGRWRIAADVNGVMELNYCLGSPAFELKAGELLYAGALDLRSENLRPDLSLDPVRLWLAGTEAAQAVRPAAWTNGSRGPCAPNSLYALEFEGAPFEPGYALGSRAPKAE